ncbi:MAG: energy transducer TonB [Candidatus Omnitrophica bacterium]|nr:energy transducer TonB [Candidatus Omnitrophota bacterium]
MPFRPPVPSMRLLNLLAESSGRTHGFLASLTLHGLLFLGGGQIFAHSARYGVEPGMGGVEISLVAAPSSARRPAGKPSGSPEFPASQESKSEWAQEPASVPAPAAQEPVAESISAPAASQGPEGHGAASFGRSQGPMGDGSSPIPGKDAITFYSPGGAVTEGKSKHLRNPAPPYPWASITRQEQGVVVLSVSVDEAGRPLEVGIDTSSGFSMLDESALKTIRRWKFDPAHVGFLPVRSNIKVPIRFVLQEEDLKRAGRLRTPS